MKVIPLSGSHQERNVLVSNWGNDGVFNAKSVDKVLQELGILKCMALYTFKCYKQIFMKLGFWKKKNTLLSSSVFLYIYFLKHLQFNFRLFSKVKLKKIIDEMNFGNSSCMSKDMY